MTTTTPATAEASPPIKIGHTPSNERLQSIDALRGFDMFWISGGEYLFHALALTTGWSWAIFTSRQLIHSRDLGHWAGFTFFDLIQPLFLFITGITLPLAVGRRLARGQTRAEVFRRLLFRAVVLVILGFLYDNGPISLVLAHNSFGGVLQRIGVAGLIAGVIMMYTRPGAQMLWAIGILAAYWALLSFVPYPGQPTPGFEKGRNIVDYLDQHFMPGRFTVHSSEGWFSSPTTVASVLFGALAGTWLISARSIRRKLLGLGGAGLALLALGRLWALQCPIIKDLFTSSYVVYATGWSCLLLALFYGIIDGLGWRRWSFPFVLIGTNPLVLYLLVWTGWINFPYIAQFFFGWAFNYPGPPLHVSEAVANLAYSHPGFDWMSSDSVVGWTFPPVLASPHPFWQMLATLAVEFLFLLWLYRRKIFWRV